MVDRFDFVFSYWIFAWYILYEIKIISYNPKIALIIATFTSTLELLTIIYFSNSFLHIFLFCFINFFIKIVPLWTLLRTGYYVEDFYALIGLFLIYLAWLFVNNVNLHSEIANVYSRIKNNKPIGPFMYYIDEYALRK